MQNRINAIDNGIIACMLANNVDIKDATSVSTFLTLDPDLVNGITIDIFSRVYNNVLKRHFCYQEYIDFIVLIMGDQFESSYIDYSCFVERYASIISTRGKILADKNDITWEKNFSRSETILLPLVKFMHVNSKTNKSWLLIKKLEKKTARYLHSITTCSDDKLDKESK